MEPKPTPSPTPIPTSLIQIGQILAMTEGSIIVPADGFTPTFQVSDEFMSVCEPEVGGYVITYGDDDISYVAPANINERFPQ